MSLTLRTTLGYVEAVIDSDGGLKRFYQIANILIDDFEVKFTSKEDDFYAISWEFKLRHYKLTLQYSIYNGISVYPTRTTNARKKENEIALELAKALKKRLAPMRPSASASSFCTT